SQGQVIGKLAVTGDISSPETHLHFGIKDENGNPVDPEKFLPSPPISSETSNSAPVETSDNSLSSGAVENSVVVSENVSTQTQSTDSEGNNLEQAQASEVNNNAGEISSTQVVSQPNEDKASQETSVVVNSLEAQTVIPSPQEENKVIPVLQVNADIPQTNSEAPVNFAEQNSTDSTNENIELKNKMNNETVDVVLSQKEVVPIIPSTRWGRDTPNVIVPKTTFTEQPRRLFYRVVGQASQTPKPQFANPLSPPFTKGGMGGLLLLLTTLGILVFSTELNKLKGYRLEAIGYGSVTYAA
ncbi:MAG: hypothetical protein HY776_07390, partial [Actinobacteria bacterium]|nr:hypothetical protein [Actinomycetota bacterium]